MEVRHYVYAVKWVLRDKVQDEPREMHMYIEFVEGCTVYNIYIHINIHTQPLLAVCSSHCVIVVFWVKCKGLSDSSLLSWLI